MNDDSGEIALLTERAATINPERMHINTVVRPPAVSGARPVGRPRLQEIAAMFGPRAEVIASPSSETQSARDGDEVGVVVEMAARRPVTAGDVAKVVGISQAAAAKLLVRLEERGVLSVVRHGENLYYRK
jgi:predicted Rossmann fold nucleotide-binding protein DprA/Smf involved in DNA uptake